MQTISLPDAPRVVKKIASRAEIEIAGCYPGYGMTLGNAIRRVLLSSLQGAAITAVKIGGVAHEFLTMPGVMEDVTLIMLNLKQVRFRMHGDGPVRVSLSRRGSGAVRAGDIQTTSELEVVNSDLVIATLTTPDAKLEMELDVEKGLGYVPVEEHRREKVEVGLIALDALFSPVKRVNYEVENMRVGERTDFNRIRFDVETDGTVSPEEAFRQSVAILVEHFGRLAELRLETSADKVVMETPTTKPEFEGEANERKDIEPAVPVVEGLIDDLKLKTRIANVLTSVNIKTISQITKKSEEELLAVEGLGEKAVKEVKKAIGRLGLTLAEKK